MATHSTSADVTALKALLLTYVSGITNTTDTDAATLWIRLATNELNLYCDALLAIQNLNASSKSSYATGLGFSAVQRAIADAETQKDAHWDAFTLACARGGVTIPSLESDGISHWSFNDD